MKNTVPCLLLLVFLVTAGIIACVSNPAAKRTQDLTTVSNWEGSYYGSIPAANGPGINVYITLFANQTFVFIYEYIDRPGITVTKRGDFNWRENKTVVVLETEPPETGTFPPYYRLGKDCLFQLDMKGKAITGNLADHYILKKVQ